MFDVGNQLEFLINITNVENVHLFRFSVDSTLNIFKKLDIIKRNDLLILPGAAHGDELCYLVLLFVRCIFVNY